MAKRSRTKARDTAPDASATPGAVGPRQPCPCGSGRRYKACHGAPGGAAPVYVARPFEGMPSECDVVAMRELVPAATAPLTLADGVTDEARSVLLCTLLPAAAPAMVREGGEIWLGLQVQHNFGDPARDLGAVLLAALDAAPGVVGLTEAPGEGPRIQDLVAGDRLAVTVHEGFDYWVADIEDRDSVAAALEQANSAAAPTGRLTQVEAAYWTQMGDKEFLRWVRPEPEDRLLDGLARLHQAGRDALVPGARMIGMFRGHGLVTPVWDLPAGTGAEALEDPAEAFDAALGEAMADTTPLTPEQRSARQGLLTRQVTIR